MQTGLWVYRRLSLIMGTETIPTPATPVRPRRDATSTNTPAVKKQTSTLHSAEYHIDHSRNALLNNIGPTIPEVPYAFFHANILPGLHHGMNVDTVIKNLKKSREIDAGGRWAAFPIDPRDDGQHHEPEVFDKLGRVIAAIIKHSGAPKNKLKVEYLSNPNSTPLCDFVVKDSKPDAHLVLKNKLTTRKDGRCYWRDICTPGKFKKDYKDGDLRDVSDTSIPLTQTTITYFIRTSRGSAGICIKSCTKTRDVASFAHSLSRI